MCIWKIKAGTFKEKQNSSIRFGFLRNRVEENSETPRNHVLLSFWVPREWQVVLYPHISLSPWCHGPEVWAAVVAKD